MHALRLGTSQTAAAAPARFLTPDVNERSLYRMRCTGSAHDGNMQESYCRITDLRRLQCVDDSACMRKNIFLPGCIAGAHPNQRMPHSKGAKLISEHC